MFFFSIVLAYSITQLEKHKEWNDEYNPYVVKHWSSVTSSDLLMDKKIDNCIVLRGQHKEIDLHLNVTDTLTSTYVYVVLITTTNSPFGMFDVMSPSHCYTSCVYQQCEVGAKEVNSGYQWYMFKCPSSQALVIRINGISSLKEFCEIVVFS